MHGVIPLFLFLLTVPSSLFKSPLLDAELMLRGPVGFLAGTPSAPDDNILAAARGEPLCSYVPPVAYGLFSSALRCSLLSGLGF